MPSLSLIIARHKPVKGLVSHRPSVCLRNGAAGPPASASSARRWLRFPTPILYALRSHHPSSPHRPQLLRLPAQRSCGSPRKRVICAPLASVPNSHISDLTPPSPRPWTWIKPGVCSGDEKWKNRTPHLSQEARHNFCSVWVDPGWTWGGPWQPGSTMDGPGTWVAWLALLISHNRPT